MYNYLIEIFESVKIDNRCYYHLADSKIFKSSRNLKDRSYYKDNKQIVLSKLSTNEA